MASAAAAGEAKEARAAREARFTRREPELEPEPEPEQPQPEPEQPIAMAAGTPVSVLCGFLGAGKTTSLKHLIQHETARGRRIAAIANDVAALNIDGALITHACAAVGAEQGASAATVLTLEGGSVCSSLQEDLAEQLADLVGAGAAYDHIFVECSGVTHPAAISSLFQGSARLRGRVRLHATITVVDCFNLRRVLLAPGAGGGTTVEDAWKSIRAEWDDSITNLYIEQIEWCGAVPCCCLPPARQLALTLRVRAWQRVGARAEQGGHRDRHGVRELPRRHRGVQSAHHAHSRGVRPHRRRRHCGRSGRAAGPARGADFAPMAADSDLAGG